MSTPSKQMRLDTEAGPSSSDDVNVHGYVHNVTPMTKSRQKPGKSPVPYFTCTLQTDRTSFSDIVGFSPDQRTQLIHASEKKTPIKLKNASKKLDFHSPTGNKYMLSRASEVTMSDPLNFSYKQPPNPTVTEMSVEDALTKSSGTYVTVTAKVVHLDDETQTIKMRSGTNLMLRNATIADATKQCRLSLWEDNIQSVSLNRTYIFHSLTVKDFESKTFLSTSPRTKFQDADPSELEDVDYVDTKHAFEDQPTMVSITAMYSCKNCYCRLDIQLNTPNIPPTFKCKNCSFRQKVDKSTKQTTMKLKFESKPAVTYMLQPVVSSQFMESSPDANMTNMDTDDLEEFLFTKTLHVVLDNPSSTVVQQMKIV